jgi:hypothetical protein
MITDATLQTRRGFTVDVQELYPGLNSLFAAAVVDRAFRELLLTDPGAALLQGYLGRGFALSEAETSVILAARAGSLTELAEQVIQNLRK